MAVQISFVRKNNNLLSILLILQKFYHCFQLRQFDTFDDHINQIKFNDEYCNRTSCIDIIKKIMYQLLM